MTKFFLRIFSLIFLISVSSCVSKKKIVYFQNDKEAVKQNNLGYELRFMQDDLLVINVSAKDLDVVKSFNLPTVAYNVMTNSVTGVPKQQAYLIDSKGEINFPILGKIKLEGLTRLEAIKLLTEKLDPAYVKDPSINIQILNFKINVLGDVKVPGAYPIKNERVTIIDALAMAGDLNISGERKIEIKRHTKEGVVTGYVDLKSDNLFSSPYYYLKQNDVVYVIPNNAKVQSASFNQNTGLFISVASVLISLISILTFNR